MSCPDHLVECPSCQRTLVAKAPPPVLPPPAEKPKKEKQSSSYSSSQSDEPRESLKERIDRLIKNDRGDTRSHAAKLFRKVTGI